MYVCVCVCVCVYVHVCVRVCVGPIFGTIILLFQTRNRVIRKHAAESKPEQVNFCISTNEHTSITVASGYACSFASTASCTTLSIPSEFVSSSPQNGAFHLPTLGRRVETRGCFFISRVESRESTRESNWYKRIPPVQTSFF